MAAIVLSGTKWKMNPLKRCLELMQKNMTFWTSAEWICQENRNSYHVHQTLAQFFLITKAKVFYNMQKKKWKILENCKTMTFQCSVIWTSVVLEKFHVDPAQATSQHANFITR